MDIRKIKKLMELIESSEIAEIEIREGEESIRLSKPVPVLHTAPAPVASTTPAPPASAVPTEAAGEELDDVPPGHVVKSPMVGTFYRAPSPTSREFVKLGDAVAKGDPICVVEAMKLMNQIEADTAGTIRAILVENAQPIEYGQPLFVIG